MKPPRSLRRDLALGLGVGVLVLWLVAMAGAWLVLRGEVNEIYDAALKQTAHRILPFAVASDGRPSAAPSRREAISYMQRTPDGAILAQSAGADPFVFGAAPKEGFRNQADHRLFGLRSEDGSVLEVADPLAERRDASRESLVAFVVPAALLLPLCLIGIAWLTAARLRPVERLADQVSKRDSGDLRPLSTPQLQAELIPIRDAVDRLMGRLAEALAAERSFSANAAHELRTPIAATLAQTQLLVSQTPEGPLRARALAIEFELKRVARLAEKLLDLARAEGAGVAAGQGQDIRPVLALVASDFTGNADLRVQLPESPVLTTMDPDAFAILARNLIENAVRHGAPPVEVSLDDDGTLRIANGGPTLPAESLARLTRRFERLGSRREGSGLGLAIVEALVRNAGARLELRSPAPGRADGLAATVAFPRVV